MIGSLVWGRIRIKIRVGIMFNPILTGLFETKFLLGGGSI